MVTVQTTPTEDATVTALNKKKLAQEVQQLKEQNEPDFFRWLQENETMLSTLLVVIGGLIGLFRWFGDRRSEVKNLEDVLSLKKTILRGVKGLTKEQLETCKAKGALIDEDPTTSSSQSIVAPPPPSQSNDAQASSIPSAQGSLPPPNTGGSSAVSSQQDSES